ETLRIWLTSPVRENARPRDGEAVGIRANGLHQCDVFLVAVIVVIRDVTCVAVLDVSRRVRISVPYRRTFAVLVPRALDLIRRSCRTPIKPLRKFAGGLPEPSLFPCPARFVRRRLFRLDRQAFLLPPASQRYVG